MWTFCAKCYLFIALILFELYIIVFLRHLSESSENGAYVRVARFSAEIIPNRAGLGKQQGRADFSAPGTLPLPRPQLSARVIQV